VNFVAEYEMAEFEPKIVAFLCNWCAYRGADLAGTSRFHYPANVRVVRFMCSGSIDPVYVLEALLNGADGVLIGGCHLGNCHYQDGNYKAKHRVEVLKKILSQVGIDEERVWLRWIGASEGKLFSDTIHQMVAEIRAKGPNPMRKPWKVWQETVGFHLPEIEAKLKK
jgi:F420-non-reducing hydrogenase iron-sulfur subunit